MICKFNLCLLRPFCYFQRKQFFTDMFIEKYIVVLTFKYVSNKIELHCGLLVSLQFGCEY